jgi:hypothetical protein
MSGYRLYFMDRFSGHIDNRREFLADDDDSAMGIAQRWYDGTAMELWSGSDKLKHWDAAPLVPLSSAVTTAAGE